MNAHYWHIERFERFVEKGTCACGAVKFFANDFCPEAIKTVDDYNKKHGKPGDPNYHNENKKEENKKVKQTLPPIPPKPQLDDKKRGGGNCLLLHKYYIANKDAIVVYFDQLGEKETCERWGISESGWRTLRAHLMPERFKKPSWDRFKEKDAPKRSYRKKEKPVIDTPSRAEIECEEMTRARDMELLMENETGVPESEPLTEEEAEELYRHSLMEERVIPRCRCPIVPVEGSKEGAEPLTLPTFPAFKDDWTEKVQVTWLLVYQELVVCQKEKAASV